MQGVLAAFVMVLLLVVLPLCMSAWGAARLFQWAASPAHASGAGRRRAARVLAVVLVAVVWGAVALGVRAVVQSAQSDQLPGGTTQQLAGSAPP